MNETPDLWGEVVGQGDTADRLRQALTTPVHAFLIVGPEGSGTREMALAAAAELLAHGQDAEGADRVRRLVAAEAHPALEVVERDGAFIEVGTAREVVRKANMTPAEGDRQVLVLVDFHLVREAAPALLKTIEEPPAGTFFIVLAEEVTTELVTIASRCMRFDLRPVDEETLYERLRAEGADEEPARVAASGAGGSLSRARLLARDPSAAARRDLWHGTVDTLDGTGATAATHADALLSSIDDLSAPLTEVHAEEIAAYEARWEALRATTKGGKVRGSKGELERLEKRHKRELRRVHNDEVRAGLAALTAGYREAMVAGRIPAERFVAASEAVMAMSEGIRFNQNEKLALQALLMQLSRW